MQASRELDALIAEKVMGKSLPYNLHEMEALARRTKAGAELVDRMVPHYSTQIADAWLVVEKMGGVVGIDRYPKYDDPDEWYWDVGFKKGTAQADTAPLAICLAALKTVEEK